MPAAYGEWPFSRIPLKDVPPGLERGRPPLGPCVQAGEHAGEERTRHQVERLLGVEVGTEVATRLAAFDDRADDRASGQQDVLPECVDQFGMVVLLGDQAADQTDVRRAICRQSVLDRAPQLGPRVGEVRRLEQW